MTQIILDQILARLSVQALKTKVKLPPKVQKALEAFQDTYNGSAAKRLAALYDSIPKEAKVIDKAKNYYRGMSLPIDTLKQLLSGKTINLKPKYVSSWEDVSVNKPAQRDHAYSPFAEGRKSGHVGISFVKKLTPSSVILNTSTLDHSDSSDLMMQNEVIVKGSSKDATQYSIANINSITVEPANLDALDLGVKLPKSSKVDAIRIRFKNRRPYKAEFFGRGTYKAQLL
jgi:hypothetical protein